MVAALRSDRGASRQLLLTGFDGEVDMLQLKDPGDEMVLEAAVGGGADRLVTFNVRHLSERARDFGIRTVRPSEASIEVQRHAKK